MIHDNIADVLIAVRAYCRGCCGGSAKEVERCTRTDCTLHPFRSRGAYDSRKRAEPAELRGQIKLNDYSELFEVTV